jgi:hypothetical protein
MFFNIKKYLDITNIFFNNLANQVLKKNLKKKFKSTQVRFDNIYILFNIY